MTDFKNGSATREKIVPHHRAYGSVPRRFGLDIAGLHIKALTDDRAVHTHTAMLFLIGIMLYWELQDSPAEYLRVAAIIVNSMTKSPSQKFIKSGRVYGASS
jgi:hypothetical protein